jgi:hypothetical protein
MLSDYSSRELIWLSKSLQIPFAGSITLHNPYLDFKFTGTMTRTLGFARGAFFSCVIIAVCSAFVAWESPGDTQSSILEVYECEAPQYTVRIVSYDPLMAHLENFITLKEREHLLELAYANSPFCNQHLLIYPQVAPSSSSYCGIHERLCSAHVNKDEFDSLVEQHRR